MDVKQIENINKDDFPILDNIRILINHKKIILISTLIVGILSVIIAFFIIEPIFLSIASVKTSTKPSGLSGLLGSSGSTPDISSLSDIASGGSSSKELALFENILLSRRCIEETIIRFKLNDEWEFRYMQDAVKNFRENVVEITKDNKSSIMIIGVFDKKPERAKEIGDFLISQLNKINTELNVQNAKNNREFIEKRYNEIKIDLSHSEDSLKEFQDKNGLVPDLVLKAVAQTQIQLETEIKTEELKLDLLKKIISPTESEVKIQEEKIDLLKKNLHNLLYSTDTTSKLRLKGSPEIVLNYLRLTRNLEISNKLLLFMLPLLEQAKIDERKEMPSVIILDSPSVPEKKEKPKRIIIVFIGLLSSFILTSFFILIYERVVKLVIEKLK
jgi:tyrosine-protein kinase Etk/Wzc